MEGLKRISKTKMEKTIELLEGTLTGSHNSSRVRVLALERPLEGSDVYYIIDVRPPLGRTYTMKGISRSNNKQSNKTRSRRMSLSIWRSKPKPEDAKATPTQPEAKKFSDIENSGEKKGIWSWKPMRAISHIGMHKLSCLFSVEVVTAQGLPSSMNGLRLSVCVRKKETKDGSVQAMPSRVDQGAADFEETLFIRCHVYCNHGSGKQLKFEPRPFWIYLVAVDAKELGFGKNFVDLSQLIQESIEKSQQGTRVRQWDTSFGLSGKAKGGELVLKLGFQIMEKDGGVQIYNPEENFKSSRFKNLTSFARRRSNSSFSLLSPRITSRRDAWTPSQRRLAEDIQGVDDFNLDDPLFHDAPPSTEKLDGGKEMVEDFDLPDFEIVDKGVEVQEKKTYEGEGSEKSIKVKSATSEVVKEIVHDQLRQTRLTELESIAKQIKDLVSMMGEDNKNSTKGDETESLRLDSDEETVTKEFLHMLEDENIRGFKTNQSEKTPSEVTELESEVYLPDLGKGLGCVVQTRDGGYLTSMNPLDKVVARNETPKLAMQMSKPYVLPSNQSLNGLELFQKVAGIGLDELSSQVFSMMPLDELIGKTAEQIAFEGIASAIIQGRNKEGASSSAARIVSALKGMANAMSSGRQERISTGLWNVDETPLTAEQILAFTMQMIEFMVVEGLKIQADMAEKEAPCDASPLWTMEGNKDKDLLGSAVSLEDWIKDQSYTSSGRSSDGEPSNITLMFVVQLRDPIRRFEAVGGPVMVLIHAAGEDTRGSDYHPDDEEKRFKVTSMHVGGLKVRSATKNNTTLTIALVGLEFEKIEKYSNKLLNIVNKSNTNDLLTFILTKVMHELVLAIMRHSTYDIDN
ncbi:Protein PLASTID MOVEMENT IMPAIRED 1 [Vigna angularis]|uniref:Protein PLASTID MOVEMENT IMPAIRED 1 n=1 Tax=Phaseolus angularis TaxID=3914 RepID=A0A8T0JWB1_PHAAN|nr:Protein PLASTID MOVEMENT IMPAIRED 1 [Vigna angularis]